MFVGFYSTCYGKERFSQITFLIAFLKKMVFLPPYSTKPLYSFITSVTSVIVFKIKSLKSFIDYCSCFNPDFKLLIQCWLFLSLPNKIKRKRNSLVISEVSRQNKWRSCKINVCLVTSCLGNAHKFAVNTVLSYRNRILQPAQRLL